MCLVKLFQKPILANSLLVVRLFYARATLLLVA